MAKKPADQTSTNGTNGAGDAVDLEVDLDNDNAGSGSGDEDDDDDDDDEDSAGGGDIAAQIQAGIAAALPQISRQFQSEMDRRINSALNKGGRKPASKDDDDNEQQDSSRQAPPKADVRGARLAFREILPDSIKLLGDDERALANDFGQNLIRARALQGFDDEEQVGREVAAETATFLRKARDLYSSRTKRALERSGALVAQGGGQSPGGQTPPSTVAAAYDAAQKKDRELFPERYAQQ
jgi:hypothetical protein